MSTRGDDMNKKNESLNKPADKSKTGNEEKTIRSDNKTYVENANAAGIGAIGKSDEKLIDKAINRSSDAEVGY